MIKNINLSTAIQLIAKKPENTWGLAYSNRSCYLVNELVRESSNKMNIISPGDHVIAMQTIYHAPILTGDRLIVESLGSFLEIHECVRGSYEKIHLTFQEILLKNLETGETNNVFCLLDFFDPQFTFSTKHKQALIIYRNKISQDYLSNSEILFDPICNPLLLRHSYAVTTHKAQGSEVDDVVLLVKSIDVIKRRPQGKNWLYTATTRAKNNLYICEDLRL